MKTKKVLAWGIRVRVNGGTRPLGGGPGTGPRWEFFLLGSAADAFAPGTPPGLRAYTSALAFRTRREARDYCREHTTRRGGRTDGFVWECVPARIEIAVRAVPGRRGRP